MERGARLEGGPGVSVTAVLGACFRGAPWEL